MDRTIHIPIADVLQWLKNPQGVAACFPVQLDWPELRLTPDQQMANAFAKASGHPEPYPDNSIITVCIGWNSEKSRSLEGLVTSPGTNKPLAIRKGSDVRP